jgi:hypothetical protein
MYTYNEQEQGNRGAGNRVGEQSRGTGEQSRGTWEQGNRGTE